MGKNLIQQRRGKGSPKYKTPSHRYKGSVKLAPKAEEARKGEVVDLINCPAHSAPLAYVYYEGDVYSVIPASNGLRVGQEVISGTTDLSVGNIVKLGDAPEGTSVYNIEAVPGDGGKFARSSGATAKVVSNVGGKVIIQFPSKKQKSFHPECRALIGTVAGGGRKEKPLLKAGKKHHKRKAQNKLYPIVSGCAMNAVDHPFGNKRSSRNSKAKPVPKHAPPGRKVGSLRARRTGRRKGARKEV